MISLRCLVQRLLVAVASNVIKVSFSILAATCSRLPDSLILFSVCLCLILCVFLQFKLMFFFSKSVSNDAAGVQIRLHLSFFILCLCTAMVLLK